MNNKYTLKELANMFASVRREALSNGQSIEGARELALKHILDAIGYEFPKDEEREAFERWQKSMLLGFGGDQYSFEKATFEAWKAGREELRKAVPMLSFDKNITITSEPDWIPWDGGDKSPIVEKQTRYEVKDRDGVIHTCTQNNFVCGEHSGPCADIIAYRILD